MASTDSGPLWSVVMPIKPVVAAKSRLSSIPAALRVEFARAFAQDALAATLDCPLVARIVIVGDSSLAPVDARVTCLTETGRGLHSAIDTGLHVIDPELPVGVLVSDLPAVRTEEISTALRRGSEHPLSLICDREGIGSTMLMSRHRRDLHHRFGRRSRAEHVACGATDLSALNVPGLRCDVDTEVDLWNARRLGVGPATRTILDRT